MLARISKSVHRRGAFALNGAPNVIFAGPTDRAGTQDLISQFFSYPKIKANLFFSYSFSDFTFRLQTRYSEGTEPAIGTPSNKFVFDGTSYVATPLGKTQDFWQHDLIVRVNLPWDTALTGSIQNVLNTDPPDAPSQYNYDYTSGNPLGRVFKIAIKKKF